MERMLKKVGCGRDRKGRGRGRGRTADRAVTEDVLLRKLLRVFPTPASACAEWVTVMEFTKRRFCGRKCDNELYRSNSFKFERFEAKEESGSLDLTPFRKQVALCDDYSIPVDFVNKRRPLSLGAVPTWSFHNFHGNAVEILENYSDPRDSKAYLEPGEEACGKVYSSPDKDYSQPYTDCSSPEQTTGEDDDGVYEHVGAPRLDTPIPRQIPYYYGDLRQPDSPNGPMPPLRGDLEDDMSRQRNFYETAFDSRISKSDDDLDVDIVINKSILPGGKLPFPPRPGPSAETPDRRKVILARQELVKRKPRSVLIRRDLSVDSLRSRDQSVDSLTQDLGRVEIHDPPLPLRGFAPPTPPSSAPLPTKFPSSHSMASVHSAPNLPGARLKDSRLPIKSVRCRIEDARALEGRPRSFMDDTSGEKDSTRYNRPKSLFCPEQNIAEIKSRPDSRPESSTAFLTTAQVLEIKGRPRRVRVKYSSTESMATSSSGGSLESIRSSTSEGNRSTSSSESHRSSSLSSHSSDSTGSTGFHNAVTSAPMGARFFHQTKLHILSPISDKSSQEPGSETSENNKNNNSQRASPEENTLASTTPVAEQSVWTADNPTVQLQKPKRRTPQNKNLINLGIGQCSGDSETHQGSDSGISIESRCGVGGSINQNNVSVDLNDLPFDMPKLRRRRLLQQPVASVQDTSGSATSVDLRDLPFDMPKLRRRLRGAPPSTESSGLSQASSSHSVQEAEPRPASVVGVGRPSLTLDLEASAKQPRSLALNLDLGQTSTSQPSEDVEVDLPLERQGWYHGAITRLEAENVLRNHDEGSYLVRNSESSRLDYSLSLKSARGFMHMRIQQCRETGKFILGQFSNPFASIPEMIRHYTVNRLPIRGAEHMCLRLPVIEQLL